MEMQQIRYFLSLAETLSFTRAAEECHVSQPALTRAIQALESELGGALLRREGRNSHLTELGRRMLPLMCRCYESAMSARDLARAVTKNEIAPLALAISHSVNLELFMPAISELFRAFPGLQLRLAHGGAPEIVKLLKDGAADLAIAGPVADDWERLDRWALFSEPFEIAMHAGHPLARDNEVDATKLSGQAVVAQTGSESQEEFARWFADCGAAPAASHQIDSLEGLDALLKASGAVAIVPASAPHSPSVRRARISGCGLTRTVFALAAAGRPRSPAVAALLNLLRASDYAVAAA